VPDRLIATALASPVAADWQIAVEAPSLKAAGSRRSQEGRFAEQLVAFATKWLQPTSWGALLSDPA